MEISYKTRGTCSRSIHITLSDDGVIESCSFEGGCPGNTQGVAALVRGMKAEEVIAMIDAIGTVDLSKAGAISAARSAYDKLTDAEKALVTNYNVLVAAEAAYAKLVTEMGKKLDEIYKTTGDFMATLGTPTVNSIGGEWMVIGLARSGRPVPAGYYDNVVEYVKAKADANERLHPAKVTDNARVILALTAIGKDVTNVGGHNLLKGLDSMDYIQTQGINGPIFTLIALDSHNYPTMGDVTREKLIQVILDAQLNDGGWDLSGTKADPDMTTMAIQALAPYYKTNETVKAAVDKAAELAKAAGARRCLPLKVSGPFHTRLMAPAGDALAERFKTERFREMQVPVLFNCLGREKADADTIPALLVRQVQSSVYMEDTLRRLGELGVDHILEVGPGSALSGFVKKTLPGVPCASVETPEQLDAALAAWRDEA